MWLVITRVLSRSQKPNNELPLSLPFCSLIWNELSVVKIAFFLMMMLLCPLLLVTTSPLGFFFIHISKLFSEIRLLIRCRSGLITRRSFPFLPCTSSMTCPPTSNSHYSRLHLPTWSSHQSTCLFVKPDSLYVDRLAWLHMVQETRISTDLELSEKGVAAKKSSGL